jgi:hypothetical protein
MRNAVSVSVLALSAAAALAMWACGTDNADIPGGNGDASAEAMPQQGGSSSDGGTDFFDASADDAFVPPACAPPSDPTKAALCIQVSHEMLTFVPNDTRLDGKGVVIAQLFATPHPDYPDGGEMPALATATIPGLDGGLDASAEWDLTNDIPVIRFDGLEPGTVYPRVFFIDNQTQVLTAGWWVAGLDLSHGLKDGLPLGPATLTKGQGASFDMNLTALRGLFVALDRSVDPSGDGRGIATIVAYDVNDPPAVGANVFGIAQNCANLTQPDAASPVAGFIIGKGPYYLGATLDDFGVAEAGSLAGALVSLTPGPDGGVVIPDDNLAIYPASSYVVGKVIVLNTALPKPSGADQSSCP